MTAWRIPVRLREIGRIGVELLFPPVCAGCGRAGFSFCPTCEQAVEPVPEPRCASCGRPQPVPMERCSHCRRHAGGPLLKMRAAALHTHPLREAIHALKYEGRTELAEGLARYLTAAYADPIWRALPRPIDAVTPVPLHPARLAERGYNQSALLAAAFCAVNDLPCRPAWLARARETRQQVGLSPVEREANVAHAFIADPGAAGKVILLIDDVLTTGATMRACAAALEAAGALAVYGLTLSQPVSRPIASGRSDDSWWDDPI